MANIHFGGKKESRSDVLKTIERFVNERCPTIVYHARFTSDDGGQILEVNVEVNDPSDTMDVEHPILELRGKYMGWRSVIVKVPIGYVSVLKGRV